jgi:predicted ATPase
VGTKKIVITGGPGSGKTALIEYLTQAGHYCMPEISRSITIKAQQDGIDQLFLADPFHFSNLLIQGRREQFNHQPNAACAYQFYDRGLPDVVAYMDYLKLECPDHFLSALEEHQYDAVFILPPWAEIYVQDNERYEAFDTAIELHAHLYNRYSALGYQVHSIPKATITERALFLLNTLNNLL